MPDLKVKNIIVTNIRQLESVVRGDYDHRDLINALWDIHPFSLDRIASAVVEVVQMRSADDRLTVTKNLINDFKEL